jgi:hypothetical protein
MERLTILWEATFKDNSKIKQFDSKGEHKYQEVLNRISELSTFSICDWSLNLWFTVDVIHGNLYFNINKPQIPPYISEEAQDIIKHNIRLIYFTRARISGVGTTITTKEVFYFLGYQYSDANGNNKKVICQIDEDCNFVIGE